MERADSIAAVIKPGLLIDGLGGPAQEAAAVVLKGKEIFWVGPEEQLTASQERADLIRDLPEGNSLILPQATLLPGLIDCHSHTNMPGDGRTGEQVDQDPDDVRLLRSARNAVLALRSGVTTLCDCGSWNRTAFSLKQGIDQGLVEGPRVMVSGPPLTITGGHLWYMGGEVDGIDSIRRQVRALVKQGADIIKVAASGGSTVTSDPYRPAFSVEDLKAVVEEAHNLRKPVAAHCRCTTAINYALDAGADIIFHGFFAQEDESYCFDQPTAERLAGSGVWVNPTHSLGRLRRDALLEKQQREKLTIEEEAMLLRVSTGEQHRIDQFSRLVGMGMKIACGSDAGWGNAPFGDFQAEVMAMTDFGLSPMEAILSATKETAEAVGKLDLVGTIEAGKEADLLLVDGNPLDDMETLRRVKAVFRAGRRVELRL